LLVRERHGRLGGRVGHRRRHDGAGLPRVRDLGAGRPEGSGLVSGTRLRHPVAAALAVAGYVIMIVPIGFVVATAFTAGSTLRFPPEGLSLTWFGEAVAYSPFMEAVVSSLELAALATALALVLGVPVTLAVHRGRIPGRGLLEGLFLSPLVVPELVVGLALYQQLMIGLHLDNFTTLLLGHTALLLPYAVRVTGASLALADPALEEAARGLGASPVRAFFTVTLPMLRPGLVSAGLLGFVTSFNNVPLSLLLQTRDFRTLPVTMLDYVQQSYDPMVAAASTLVLAATVVVAVVAERTVGFAKIFGGINR